MNQKPLYLSHIGDIPYMDESSVKFTYKEASEDVKLLNNSKYSFLFVLQGSVEIHYKQGNEVINSEMLIVVDKEQITKCICAEKTMLLEFIPPNRINRFFLSASNAFNKSYSEQIPFNDDISKWVDDVWNKTYKKEEIDQYNYCQNLGFLLSKYPHSILGTLFIPIYACASKCGVCSDIIF